MKFSQVIGHQKIKHNLIRNTNAGKVSHAQMFIGPRGSGKLAMALAYAQYVNCLDQQANDSCGKCRACIKSQKLVHPDIHYSYATIGSKAKSTDFAKEWRVAILQNPYLTPYEWLQHIKAENKQGNITKHECEDIIHKLNYKAFEGKYKVLIMWIPEYLGKEGNRLLKMIEEPAPNTLFLLVAENQDQILNTILSRTQMLRIPRLADAEIKQALIEIHQLNAVQAERIAAIAEGNYQEALQLINSEANDNQELLGVWLTACLKRQVVKTDQFIEQIAGVGRESQKNFLSYCLHFWRQCVFMQVVQPQQVTLSEQEVKLAQYINRALSIQQLEQIVDLFNKAFEHIGRNANPKVLFLNLSIQVTDIIMGQRSN